MIVVSSVTDMCSLVPSELEGRRKRRHRGSP